MNIELYTDEELIALDESMAPVVDDFEKSGNDILNPRDRTKILRILLRKAFELHPAPVLPEWISIAERGPGSSDLDEYAATLALSANGILGIHTWWGEAPPQSLTHWMPCSAIVNLPRNIVPVDPHEGFKDWYESATAPERLAAAIHGWKAVIENPNLVLS